MDMIKIESDGSIRIDPELTDVIEEVTLFVVNRPIIIKLISERRDHYAAAALILSLAAAQCS